jgi:hypothetical protein
LVEIVCIIPYIEFSFVAMDDCLSEACSSLLRIVAVDSGRP